MGKFVGVSVVLFVLAVAFVVVTQGPEMASLVAAFRSEPLLHKIAWAVIVLVPLVMLPFAVWLWDGSCDSIRPRTRSRIALMACGAT